MTTVGRVRLVFYVALLVTVFWMLQGIAHTRPPDNRPKPGPTAPPRPTR